MCHAYYKQHTARWINCMAYYTKYEMNIINRLESTESNIIRSYIIVKRINITKECFTARIT